MAKKGIEMKGLLELFVMTVSGIYGRLMELSIATYDDMNSVSIGFTTDKSNHQFKTGGDSDLPTTKRPAKETWAKLVELAKRVNQGNNFRVSFGSTSIRVSALLEGTVVDFSVNTALSYGYFAKDEELLKALLDFGNKVSYSMDIKYTIESEDLWEDDEEISVSYKAHYNFNSKSILSIEKEGKAISKKDIKNLPKKELKGLNKKLSQIGLSLKDWVTGGAQ